MAQGVGVLDAEVDADAVLRAASAGGGTAPGDVVVPDLPGNLRDRIDALAVDGDLGEVLVLLASDLVGFQDTRCAADFLGPVPVVHGAEERVAPGSARLTEAVARGHLRAPGFFQNPLRRRAWLGSEWMGPARPTIDPVKDATADEKYLEMGVTSLTRISAERFGMDQRRVRRRRAQDGSDERAAASTEVEIAATDDRPDTDKETS